MVCAALAVVTLGWVLRDLAYSGDPRELWWRWASMPTSYGAQDVVYTAGPDLFLAVVYVAVAVRVPRSTSAAALLAVTGASPSCCGCRPSPCWGSCRARPGCSAARTRERCSPRSARCSEGSP
ncbi:hypothetical protein NQP46_23220 [Streptomyces albus]|nr:hypothetical protein NQP46_23220 [Streptomyces albus]